MLWPNGSKTRPHISSNYGPRRTSIPGASRMHRGTDFVGFSTIRAIAAGTVERIGTPAGWSAGGIQVWVRHNGGSLSRYLHLRSYSVRAGQRVTEGQALGIMGATGTASGVHLHLEVVPANASGQVDPVKFIEARIGGSTASAPKPSQDVRSRQAWLNQSRGEKLIVDGILGSATKAAIKRYQQFLGITADGIWGPATQSAHQRYYDAWHRPKIAVDGVWGRNTTKALQSALGVKADGIIGPDTIRALQRKTGVTADGIEGPATRKALQRHLGVRQDGVWGPATARALQTRLNAGTF